MADTTTTSGPPSWLAPYYQNYLNGAFGVANRPWQGYQGPRVAGMSSITQGALGGMQGAMYGNPATWGGMGLLGNIIGGDSNRNVNQVADTVTRDATRAFDSRLGNLNDVFSNPNSFGSDRHALGASQLTQDFGRGLSDSLGQLRYSAFDNERQRQMQAASQAQQMNNSQMQNLSMGMQAGMIPRQIQQQQYDTAYNDWRDWRDYPNQQLGMLGNALGMGGGRFGTSTTQSPDPSRMSQMLGGGILAYPWLFGSGNSGGGASSNSWQGLIPWMMSGG